MPNLNKMLKQAQKIKDAYDRNPKLANLLLDPYFQKIVEGSQDSWRLVVATARQDNEWLGAWPVDRTRENIDELTVEPGVTLTIRSWRGTFDRKVVTAE